MDDATPHAPAPQSPHSSVYLRDADSTGVVRQALSDLGANVTFKSDPISVAIADLAKTPSPRLLVVDVSGEGDPVGKVRELVKTCEPSTSVVVVGDKNDIALYRSIRDAGASDYFFKPLVFDLVARACRTAITGAPEASGARTGQAVFVIGIRGGCGATTVATRLAWRLSQSPPRPVLLLDLDLKCGDVALQLDGAPNHALTEALAEPERVDDLFLERGLIHVNKRLDVMASLEPIDSTTTYSETSLDSLIARVQHRYRYVVVDVPAFTASAISQTLHMPSMTVLVSDGRLVSAREIARWRAWLGGSTPSRTVLHVLNMSHAPGSLPIEEFTRAAGQAPDMIIPYTREVAASSLVGVKASPECPPMDRGLEPIIAHLTGEPYHKPGLFERVLG